MLFYKNHCIFDGFLFFFYVHHPIFNKPRYSRPLPGDHEEAIMAVAGNSSGVGGLYDANDPGMEQLQILFPCHDHR